MADTQDLGSCTERCGGSSPPSTTDNWRISNGILVPKDYVPKERLEYRIGFFAYERVGIPLDFYEVMCPNWQRHPV